MTERQGKAGIKDFSLKTHRKSGEEFLRRRSYSARSNLYTDEESAMVAEEFSPSRLYF